MGNVKNTKNMKKLLITFSVNDGIEEQHEVPLLGMNDEEITEEIDRNISAINERQDEFIKKWEIQFPMEVKDRAYINKMDSEGYYIDGYLFMRKIDLKRGYFEGKLEIV